MEIRELNESDIKSGLELVWKVFEEFEAPEYPEEGVKSFKEFINCKGIVEKLRKHEMSFIGAYDNNKIVGIIAERDKNHISLLFVDKQYHRRGIATKLFKRLEERCKSQNFNSITVNSSPYAVNIYHKLGFIDLDKEQLEDGIRFTPMEYKIK